MKTLYLLLLALCCISYTYGQKIEASFSLNSGVSKFGGAQAASTTTATRYGSGAPSYYSTNPYGSRYGMTYGASLQVQLVMPEQLLVGTQVGFEQLSSQIKIDQVYGHPSYSSALAQPADGASTIKANFMNLHPYLGWRVHKGTFDIDITLG